jgi:hypothetical protein
MKPKIIYIYIYIVCLGVHRKEEWKGRYIVSRLCHSPFIFIFIFSQNMNRYFISILLNKLVTNHVMHLKSTSIFKGINFIANLTEKSIEEKIKIQKKNIGIQRNTSTKKFWPFNFLQSLNINIRD